MNNTAGIRNPDGSFFTVRTADHQHRRAERGQPERAVLQHATSRRRSIRAAVDEPDVGRLVARVHAHDRARRRLRPRRRDATSACAGRSTRASTAARRALCRPAAQPGQPDDEHEHRLEQVRRHQHRHPPAHERGISFNAWYSLSKAKGLGGLGLDELTTNLVQNSFDPYGDVQLGPAARTDARHKITLSAVIQLPWGFYCLAGLPLPLGAADAHLVRL